LSKVVQGIYLLVGANQGEPPKTFQTARQMLNPFIRVSRVSSLYITPPWKMLSENWFYNQVWEVETDWTPMELLDEILRVESALGRIRNKSGQYEDRIIDIDILLFKGLKIDSERLKVPHPHLEQRAFALLPLLELDSELSRPGESVKYQRALEDLAEDTRKIKRLE